MAQCIGIITNDQHRVFQRHVIQGVQDAAAAQGFDVVIDSYGEDPAHPRPVTLDYRAVAGVVGIADAIPVPLLREMVAAGTPVSLVSHTVPDVPVPAVVADNAAGIVALVQHVVTGCDRRNLVYIGGIRGQRDSEERATALRRELMRYNLTVPDTHMRRGDFDPDVATTSVCALLDSGAVFDAVIAADYLMGIAALSTLREAGINVPEQVVVVAFGDASEAETAGLTTVSADVVEQGRRAARQLLKQVEGLHITGVTVLSVDLIVRETSRMPSEN
ncbi:MAG: substrate-binding domain-containing protein [Anaerolineae bacterium]|nr:substrate-binding domain-containing protein [Anaerolineae bacterium]